MKRPSKLYLALLLAPLLSVMLLLVSNAQAQGNVPLPEEYNCQDVACLNGRMGALMTWARAVDQDNRSMTETLRQEREQNAALRQEVAALKAGQAEAVQSGITDWLNKSTAYTDKRLYDIMFWRFKRHACAFQMPSGVPIPCPTRPSP